MDDIVKPEPDISQYIRRKSWTEMLDYIDRLNKDEQNQLAPALRITTYSGYMIAALSSKCFKDGDQIWKRAVVLHPQIPSFAKERLAYILRAKAGGEPIEESTLLEAAAQVVEAFPDDPVLVYGHHIPE